MTATTATADTTTWLLAPAFLLRVAGLPIEAADALATPHTGAWADRVMAMRVRLATAARHLADALEAAVADHREDRSTRRDLINVRRDVFNLRAPDRRAADRLAAVLDAGTGDALAEWRARHARYTAEAHDGEEILRRELARGRQVLRALAHEPALRHGMLLASPTLDEHLPGHLAAAGPAGKRGRRIERSLLEYLYRTAAKTSPFSTLTTVRLGAFDDSGTVLSTAGGSDPVTRARLNVAVLSRLSAAIVDDEARRSDLPVVAAPGWRHSRDQIRYLRRRVQALDEPDGPAVDRIREAVFYLPNGDLIGAALDLLARQPGLRLGELDRALRDAAGDRDRAGIEQYLARLVRIGLLIVPDLHIDMHDPDPLATYGDGVAALDRPWAAALTERLERVAATVAGYPGQDLDGRRAALGAIRSELRGAFADLGASAEVVPQTLVFEDGAAGAHAAADRGIWDGRLLADLRELTGLLPVLDITLPRRLVTKAYFRARYGEGGRCDDVLAFAHEFQRDFFEHFRYRLRRRSEFDEHNRYVPLPNWFNQPELDAIGHTRVELARRVEEAWRELPPGATELQLGRSLVNDIRGLTPAMPDRIEPHSFLLQLVPAAEGAEPVLVLNRAYGGLTQLFSRFTHLFGELPEALRGILQRTQPTGAVFAEISGGYDTTNLNLHPPVTPYVLTCPGEFSSRRRDEQIHLDELVIEDDLTEDRLLLRSRRLGLEVIPLYLGFLMPLALPEIQQVLLNFAPTAMSPVDLWAGTALAASGRAVAERPRIRYGNVVVARRSWLVPPDAPPAPRAPDEAAAAWFLRWRAWQREHGLPRRVFATTLRAAPPEPAGAGVAPPRPVAPDKPAYVDFNSYFSVGLLDAAVRQGLASLMFAEMLPDAEHLVVSEAGGSYVSEFAIEIDAMRSRP